MIPTASSLRRPGVAATTLALALALTACGTDDAAAPASAPSPASSGMDMGGSSAQSASVDAQFLTAMVPHHQSASDMAEIAVARVQDPRVKAIAQQIFSAQGAEIQQMTQFAKTKFDTTPSTEMGAMTHEMMGMTMTMDMGADIEKLRTSTTPDVTFLELMIPHHASALTMADEEIKNGTDPEVTALAEKIKQDQAKEIGMMQALLSELA